MFFSASLRRPVRLLGILLLAIGLLSLFACSRIGLAYRNLDLIIPWSLNDYLRMNEQQQGFFDEQLQEQLRWHCSHELPRYREWIASIQRMTAKDEVNEAELTARFDEAKDAIDELARRITPSTVQLLRDLDDEQVQKLGAALDKDIAERREKYVSSSLQEQIEERAERMQKRLTPWFGRLNPAQRSRVLSWSRALGGQNREWIENRAHWQNELKAALAQRQAADFEERITNLLQKRQEQWTPAYRQIFANAEVAARDLLLDLYAQADASQRERLQKRLSDLQKELAGIKCEPR